MKRTISILLCILMLLPMISVLASCSKGGDGPKVSKKTVEIDLSEYTVVVATDLSSNAKTMVTQFTDGLKAATSLKMKSANDAESASVSTEDKEMLEGVLPYPSESLEEFSAPYLTGFIAKKRDVERDALSEEVRERMQGYADRLLRNTIDGEVSRTRPQLNIHQSHWEYALMPVWVLN